MATLYSDGVALGSDDDYRFDYVPTPRRPPHRWLNVCVVNRKSDDSIEFYSYKKLLIDPTGVVELKVPPPRLLNRTAPYLLLAVATDNEGGEVPSDLQAYMEWINREIPPFTVTGMYLKEEQVHAARRAAEKWADQSLPIFDARRSLHGNVLEESLITQLDLELPVHRIDMELAWAILEVLEYQPSRKRSTNRRLIISCSTCVIAYTTLLVTLGFPIAFKLLFVARMPGQDTFAFQVLQWADRAQWWPVPERQSLQWLLALHFWPSAFNDLHRGAIASIGWAKYLAEDECRRTGHCISDD